jgi:hypothetical protein
VEVSTKTRHLDLALQALKATLRQKENLTMSEALERARPGKSGLPIVEQMLNSEDFFEGPRAFVEKRQPSGRAAKVNSPAWPLWRLHHRKSLARALTNF